MLPGSLLRKTLAALATTAVVVTTVTVASSSGGAAVDARAVRRVDDPQVLAISLDGFNPAVLRRLGRAGAPHLWRLFDEGAGTLNARTEPEMTVTLPNHTGMVTGRRIARGKGGHGVTWNDDRLTPPTVQKAARHAVASVFTRVDRSGGSAALFSTKTKFSLFDRSWPTSIDEVVIRDNDDTAVARAALSDLRAHDREFTFLHLGAADVAGHATGWLSPTYVDAVRLLDRLVGTVLTAADSEPALADLTILLTADHGGVPGTKDHGDATRAANYRVPFVAWGPGITHRDLYAINPGYRDPRGGRPTLRGKQPVRNGNVANLALDLLDLPRVPGSQFGRTTPLRVTVG